MITQTGDSEIPLPYRIVGYDRHGHTLLLMSSNSLEDVEQQYPEFTREPCLHAGVDMVHVLAHSEHKP